MISLTTFREDAGDITADPTGRTDRDITALGYDDATGLLIRKTWADGTQRRHRLQCPELEIHANGRAGVRSPPGATTYKGGQQLRLQQRLHATASSAPTTTSAS